MTPRSTTNSPPSLRTSATSGPVPTERDAPRPGPRSIAAERAREALRRGWQAHLLGDRNGALFQLETLVRGLAGLGEDRQAVMLGLSLYAFTVASVGENEKAVEAANTVASIARRLDPARNTPWAVRNRLVNGRSITNKITVGDEFESGQGSVTFDRFDADQGLVYREGDPYAKLLADAIDDTLAEGGHEGLALFRQALGEGIASAHWDLYWKLFCAHEDYLPVDSLASRLASLRSKAHRLADLPSRAWVLSSQAVNVSVVDDETIFAGPALRTAEYERASGRCMVWVTSQPSDAFQIVQRPQSGWVNWGTNAENECPGLPTGTDIKCAFGDFGEDWRDRAAALAVSPCASVSACN